MPPTDEQDARPRSVQSVERALDILEALASRSAPSGVTELAREVGLPAGTTHRLLVPLLQRGWVRQDSARRYTLGLAAGRLSDGALRQVAELSSTALRAAVEATGETANLAVLEGNRMVYLAQSPSPHTLRIFAEVGRRVPVHSTAVGKATLSLLPTAEAALLVGDGPFPARTPHTLTSAEEVLAAVEAAREEGFALDDEEQEIGVRCVAVPVPGPVVPMALSVSGPTERMTRERARELVPALTRVARGLAQEVRGR